MTNLLEEALALVAANKVAQEAAYQERMRNVQERAQEIFDNLTTSRIPFVIKQEASAGRLKLDINTRHLSETNSLDADIQREFLNLVDAWATELGFTTFRNEDYRLTIQWGEEFQ